MRGGFAMMHVCVEVGAVIGYAGALLSSVYALWCLYVESEVSPLPRPLVAFYKRDPRQ